MESFDLEAFLFEVRRFWWLILLTTVAAVGCGYVMHLLAPIEYKSDAKMVVGGKLNIPSASVYNEQAAAADFLGTQAAVMQSRDVRRDADKALRQQGKLPPEKGVELQATYIAFKGARRSPCYADALCPSWHHNARDGVRGDTRELRPRKAARNKE
jgi:hypothetical protein